jgi:hypothetical protein
MSLQKINALKDKLDQLFSLLSTKIDGKLGRTENAESASRLNDTFNISLTGPLTGNVDIDGSADVTIPVTLTPTGVGTGWATKVQYNAGGQIIGTGTLVESDIPSLNASKIGAGEFSLARFPNSGATAGSYGSNITVPVLNVDSKGRITSVSTVAIRAGSTTQTGLLQLNNTLTSTSTTQALTAAQGKLLQDGKVNVEVGKGLSSNDYTSAEKTKLTGIEAGAQVNVGTDLSISANNNVKMTIASSTGTSIDIASATVFLAGLMAAVDKEKLDSISSGAQVNDTAAQLLTKIKTVDGPGSGLDADTLDGQQLAAIQALWQAYTDSAISDLIGTAPETLDTINEIATALNNDPDVINNILTQLGQKLDSGSYTAADVLQKLLTVDGPGSGLNADLLDGMHASSFATSAQGTLAVSAVQPGDLGSAAYKDVPGTGINATTAQVVMGDDSRLTNTRDWNASIVSQTEAEAGTATTARKWTAQRVRQAIAAWWAGTTDKTKLDSLENVNLAAGTNITISGTFPNLEISATDTNTTYTAGTGLSLTGSEFSLSGVSYSAAEQTKLAGIETGAQVNVAADLSVSLSASEVTVASSTGTDAVIPAVTTTQAGVLTASDKTKLDGIEAGAQVNVGTNITTVPAASTVAINSSTGTDATMAAATQTLAGVMTAADKAKLDGIASGAQANVATNLTTSTAASTLTVNSSTGTNATLSAATTTLAGVMTAADKVKLNGIEAGAQVNDTAAEILTKILTVDGPASGLNADLIDGQHITDLQTQWQNYTDNKVSELVGTAPAALDTVYELAAALNNDPDVINNMMTQIGQKANSADLGTAALLDVASTGNATTSQVVKGSDTRLTDSRQWNASSVSQTEAEAGVATTDRKWSSLRVRQATEAWWSGSVANERLNGLSNVNLVAGPNVTISGTYPNLTISASTGGVYTAGSGITLLAGEFSLTGESFTTTHLNKLNGIEAGAQVNVATNLGSSRTSTTYSITSSTGSNTSLAAATTTLAGLMTSSDKSKLDGIAAGAQVNVATDLSATYATGTVTVNSSTGSNIALAAATTSLAGVMSSADKTKLDGVATGATANRLRGTAAGSYVSGDVTLLAGSNVSISQSGQSITINSTDTNTTYTAGTGLSLSGTAFSLSGEEFTTALLTKLNGIETGAQVNVATNLGVSRTTTAVTVTSSTGSNVALPAATTSLAGVLTSADKTKLDGIAAGAQVNVATNLSVSTAASTLTVVSSTGTNATLPAATTSLAGVLTASDKSKLDGLSNVSLTGGTNVSISGTYPNLTINATDTNTTYSAGAGIGLSGTTFSVSGNVGITADTSGVSITDIAAGSTTAGAIKYNGTTKVAGKMYGGTTAPSNTTRLNYDGDLYVTNLFATTDVEAGASDMRLKKDIVYLDDALSKVMQLNGFVYSWTPEAVAMAGFDTDARVVSLSAQDVQKVLPEAVSIAGFDRDENGNSISGENYLTFNLGRVVPLLVEALKELKSEKDKEIDDLRVELNALRGEMAELRALITK